MRACLAFSLLLATAPSCLAQEIDPAVLARHVHILASDDYAGRAPATDLGRRVRCCSWP